MECDLLDDVGVFVASGHVIAYDPRKAIFNNQLGENHVGVNLLYCPSNVLVVMTICKWSLAQTILDGYSFGQVLIFYDENQIPIVDEEGKTSVKKKQYTF